MNYQQIYDAFISSRISRVLDDQTVYQKHHIIPRHEDPQSKELVYLTVKEHAFAHRLRYRITSTPGNYVAWKMLSGKMGKEELLSEQSRLGGLKGGSTTKSGNKGIFSSEWDRSAETSARWKDGRISHDHFKHLRETDHYVKIGCLSRDQKKGFHSDDFDLSESNRKIWANYTEEEYNARCENMRNAQNNLSDESRLRRLTGSRQGGLTSSKIPMWTDGLTNRRSHTRPGDEWKLGQTRRHKVTKIMTTYYYKEKPNE